MAKFSKKWAGVEAGQIYPTTFAVGDDCPEELEGAALAAGALEDGADVSKPAAPKPARVAAPKKAKA